MKKVMLVFAMSAIIMAVATVKAEGAVEKKNSRKVENIAVVEENMPGADSVNYKIRLRMRDLNKVMHLEAEQIEGLQFTCSDLSRRVARLQNVPVAERQARLSSIVAENLSAVHEMVSAEQYRLYLSFLNNEFNKAGLNTILFNEVAAN